MKLLLVVAALALLVLVPSAQATRSCGLTPRIQGVRYDVRETKGAVACRTVKSVVTQFLRAQPIPKGWVCFRGHGSSPYAASCARGTKVLVRVYAPN